MVSPNDATRKPSDGGTPSPRLHHRGAPLPPGLQQQQPRASESSESDDENDKAPSSGQDAQQRAKREKRLAMNRASARERRRRKRILLEKLEERVLELTKQVQTLQEVNEGLQGHVRKLEGELSSAHTVIATLSSTAASARTRGLVAVDSGAAAAAAASLGLPPAAATAAAAEDPRLRSILLAGKGAAATAAASLQPEVGAAAGLNDLLAERQLALLEEQSRRRSLLESAATSSTPLGAPTAAVAGLSSAAAAGLSPATTAGLASSAAAGAAALDPRVASLTGPSLPPILGRLNYLNALTDNTLAARGSGIQSRFLLEGESKVDSALQPQLSRGSTGAYTGTAATSAAAGTPVSLLLQQQSEEESKHAGDLSTAKREGGVGDYAVLPPSKRFRADKD
eukprot:CAMPEP_0116847102 /NCGR_PEP_ID=MMETSP0418-20121206/14241_1 /TAXON_ID=1158023 /ORGANISM="Astrosyne radiata, Strain 13vi08-1A" /LENGTH=396 /DNA_ID=CAMNT_0004478497 /DNA_START=70 /DNA_END=1260 /DNA_ORIENTATION=-